jgi:protein ImuB
MSADAPLVVVQEVKSALRLAAVNDAAARLGLKTGMALADARAMYPAIAAVNADPEADRRLLEAIADWCDRYTPLVGLDPPHGLVLDITGCAHLFGGEAALGRDIVRRLAMQGFCARAAVADTVGCAWAMARHGTLAIIPSEQTEAVLLSLPLQALRIAPDTDAELAQVGLKRIADVIARPRAPLAARFGEAFVRRIDQAVGREDEPITPRLPVPAVVAERRFPDPIALEADVLGTIEHLARELKDVLERRGEGARLLQVALFRADGKVHRLEIGTAAPVRDPSRMRRLFAERLAALGDACDPGFGFDLVRLAALVTEPQEETQTGLAAPDHGAELMHLIDRFGARFGLRRIVRLVAQDTHIPEFAVAAMPAHAVPYARIVGVTKVRATRSPPPFTTELGPARVRSRKDSAEVGNIRLRLEGQGEGMHEDSCQLTLSPPLPRKRGREQTGFAAIVVPLSLAEEEAKEPALVQDSLSPTRPIRLLERPEPIEAIAEVPDGPPVQFTWRRVKYAVAHAEGPERIAMEWWRDHKGEALTRDYFRVESREGVRVWLYREGFFQGGPPPNWFLHGLFA